MVKDRSKIKSVKEGLTYLVDVEVTCSVGISHILSSPLDKVKMLLKPLQNTYIIIHQRFPAIIYW